MAATRAQQVGIWIMAAIMAVGTIGSFVVIVLGNENQQADSKRFKELSDQYEQRNSEYQQKIADRNAPYIGKDAELSEKYFSEFNAYSGQVGAFNKDEVTELKKEDLKVGEGKDVKSDTAFVAYYLGWNPEGTVFDGSLDGDKLKAPLIVEPGSVIPGWTRGVEGMKVGGVRMLTIPADLAYGEKGSGEHIKPNMPIRFVVMIIDVLDPVPSPEVPEELLKLYQMGVRG